MSASERRRAKRVSSSQSFAALDPRTITDHDERRRSRKRLTFVVPDLRTQPP